MSFEDRIINEKHRMQVASAIVAAERFVAFQEEEDSCRKIYETFLASPEYAELIQISESPAIRDAFQWIYDFWAPKDQPFQLQFITPSFIEIKQERSVENLLKNNGVQVLLCGGRYEKEQDRWDGDGFPQTYVSTFQREVAVKITIDDNNEPLLSLRLRDEYDYYEIPSDRFKTAIKSPIRNSPIPVAEFYGPEEMLDFLAQRFCMVEEGR